MNASTAVADLPRRPFSRKRRALLVLGLVTAALAVLIAVSFGTGLITVYDAPGNAGVVIGVECHNIGYEWRGVPGFFANSCS